MIIHMYFCIVMGLYMYVVAYVMFISLPQSNSISSLLSPMPSSNGLEELSQPREGGSGDINLHPPASIGKKMSAPGNLQPYVQVCVHMYLYVSG